VETRTAGSASGLGKRTGSNPDTAPQVDSTPSRAEMWVVCVLIANDPIGCGSDDYPRLSEVTSRLMG
jgi:hypothetical protein